VPHQPHKVAQGRLSSALASWQAAAAAQGHREGKDAIAGSPEQTEHGEALCLHSHCDVGNNELCEDRGCAMVEKLHTLGGGPGAEEGMDAVVCLHHDSPAQETKDLPGPEAMPPGREGKGG